MQSQIFNAHGFGHDKSHGSSMTVSLKLIAVAWIVGLKIQKDHASRKCGSAQLMVGYFG